MTIIDSNGPLVLPPLPHWHTYVVTSSLMHMLTARGLFLGLPSEDSHAYIEISRSLCKTCVGISDFDMSVIVLQVFPLLLIGDAAIWFTEFPYNSMYTFDQLRYVLLVRHYPLPNKLNHKDKVNNFVAIPAESVSSSWDRFTTIKEAFQTTPLIMSH